MISCSVEDICSATSARLIAGSKTTEIRGVETDSRKVSSGNLFVAFPGERVDGNMFAATALENGASCVVLTREPEPGVCETAERLGSAVLIAADKPADSVAEDSATEFVLKLAGWWRRKQNWTVVGVTGSVGKTTTKDMLKAALSAPVSSPDGEISRKVWANQGNHNNLIGVPLTIFEAPDDTEILVCEMGMNHKGEINRLAEAALPHIGVITNVGTSHIGMLGSRENIARAKAEMVPWLKASGSSTIEPTLVMTSDNDFASFIQKEYAEPNGVSVELVGEGASAVLSLTRPVELDEHAHPTISFKANKPLNQAFPAGSYEAHLSLCGKQTAPDFLLAVAAAAHLGATPEHLISALEKLESTHMRNEVVVAACGCRIIDDSYNASPDSTAAALDTLCSMSVAEDGRRIAILGEIGELGEEENRLHELVGAYAAAKPLDILVIVGTTRANHMENAAKLMGYSEDKIVRVTDVEALVSVVASILEPADLVLVKASRAAELDTFIKAVCA